MACCLQYSATVVSGSRLKKSCAEAARLIRRISITGTRLGLYKTGTTVLCSYNDRGIFHVSADRLFNPARQNASPASLAASHHALDQCDRDFHHDRQRLENLQRRRDLRLFAFSRCPRHRQMGATRAAMAFLRHVDFRAERACLSDLWHRDRPLPPKTVSDLDTRDSCDRRRRAALSPQS